MGRIFPPRRRVVITVYLRNTVLFVKPRNFLLISVFEVVSIGVPKIIALYLYHFRMSKRLFSQITGGEENESNAKQAAIPLSKSNPDLVNGIPLSGEDYLLVVR